MQLQGSHNLQSIYQAELSSPLQFKGSLYSSRVYVGTPETASIHRSAFQHRLLPGHTSMAAWAAAHKTRLPADANQVSFFQRQLQAQDCSVPTKMLKARFLGSSLRTWVTSGCSRAAEPLPTQRTAKRRHRQHRSTMRLSALCLFRVSDSTGQI